VSPDERRRTIERDPVLSFREPEECVRAPVFREHAADGLRKRAARAGAVGEREQRPAVRIRKAAPVEKAVQKQSPEPVIRRKDHETSGRPTPLEASGAAPEPELLVRTESEVGDDVELDPVVLGSVVRKEEDVRPTAVATQASKP
jgi:hypothetical protein